MKTMVNSKSSYEKLLEDMNWESDWENIDIEESDDSDDSDDSSNDTV